MLDQLDRILWWLERHRVAALSAVGVAVVAGVAILLIGGGGSTSAAPAVPAGAVAEVGARPITRSTFDHWAAVYRRSGVGGTNPSAAQVNQAVLQILVAASWTEQEAAKLGVKVSDAEVNQAVQTTFQQAKAQGTSQAQVLQQVGGTVDDLRWEERASLLGRALEVHAGQQAKPVTAADIAGQYQADGARWARPSRRDAQVLLTADRASADKAIAALKAGTPWATVATQYGSKQVAKAQTTLRGATPGVRDPAFERALFAAPVGVVAGPTQVASGYLVFQVSKSTPIAAIPLSKATNTLRSELTSARQAKAVADYLASFRRSWRARTRCITTVRDTTVCGA